MRLIEPHIHMVSRTTDDYRALALAGVRTVTEPAFWAGFDRGSSEGFRDYFEQLTVTEPARAAKFGIRHYCWLCLNPKEAEDPALTADVLELLPRYLERPTVLGVGEIGLNRNTRNELAALERHLELAGRREELVLVHTPHLEDKLKGTRLILDAIRNERRLEPGRVLIDHVEEHTLDRVRDRGHWAGVTLYPTTKCSPARAVDLLEVHGAERVWLNSAADWGVSDPLATLRAAEEMRRRGHRRETVEEVLEANPRKFLSQSPKFAG